MSYRAFKRLLGETSLERKCRFLFGAGIVLLITGSFWLYAYLTENLAYEQIKTTCRLLVHEIVRNKHDEWELDQLRPKGDPKQRDSDRNVIAAIGHYQHHWLRGSDPGLESFERDFLKEFASNEEPRDEADRRRPSEKLLYYYGAVRARDGCIACHEKISHTKIKKGDLLGVVRIRMPTEGIVEAVHVNRAVLMATALGTALLIMTGSWIIVRYVIVKPVKHLKEVSDAISAGELNVRSEIQTGDEFEDLSHAFNRMLRNLVSMQDQYRKVNSDLDRKVDELAQANMALYESNRLKSDFLATMSHELRTPLNSILGFSEVLRSSDRLDDKQQRWVRNIQSSGEKLLNLINDILDLAKIEAGKMQVRLEDFRLHDVCDGLLNMFRPLAEKKNIELRGQIDQVIPTLRQDVTKLQQILQNLLSNAIKFTPEGGRVALKAHVESSNVVLTVTDTGVGIAPEEQGLVFEKFRQAGNPLTREHAGTGLGLSIVRELTKLLGGEVFLQSELGRGSTFTIHLPLHLSAEPRLEFDLADERIDLSKAQRVDVRLYANSSPAAAVAPPTPVNATDL
ncbi:MAG: HAMP domain-containing protein [Planctomycetes bacterium]|nr:HAMP domain-containing protein [Planctomycetota bacterium]